MRVYTHFEWQNSKLVSILSCYLFFPVLLYCNNYAPYDEIPMYPTPEFSSVEKICKALCTDLEVLNFNDALYKDWVENSDYLFNQFLILNNSITNLVDNTEESRFYLLEDIHYLQEAMSKVENAYYSLYTLPNQNPFHELLYTILLQSKEKLHELLSSNQEVACI